MRRFFLPGETLSAGVELTLSGPLAHRLARVLRLPAGEHVMLLDGAGLAGEAELTHVATDVARARVLGVYRAEGEPLTRVTLYQALLRADKWDLVLQKGTELGVARFVPLVTERAQVRTGADAAKMARWAGIVREAAEQSGRARLPEVAPPTPLRQALAQRDAGLRLLMATVSPEATPLRRVLEMGVPADIGLLIGPEGDFTQAEVSAARGSGAEIVSLGARVLRAETAPLAALAAILYAAGEM